MRKLNKTDKVKAPMRAWVGAPSLAMLLKNKHTEKKWGDYIKRDGKK